MPPPFLGGAHLASQMGFARSSPTLGDSCWSRARRRGPNIYYNDGVPSAGRSWNPIPGFDLVATTGGEVGSQAMHCKSRKVPVAVSEMRLQGRLEFNQ